MKSPNIWIGEKDLTKDPSFIEESQLEFRQDSQELAEGIIESNGNRRDFLKILGFGVGAATVAAGCDIPVKRAIPYVTKPDEIVPGVATYYASAIVQGGDFCPVLVKTREGRPIKIEGNKSSDMTHGGTSARAQAAVLSLYDTNRYRNPLKITDEAIERHSWSNLLKELGKKVSADSTRIVTNTVMSPSLMKAMTGFAGKDNVISYDSVSSAAMLDANESTFGMRSVPNYRFDKAEVIVSFNADFLGTWISPIEFSRQYIAGRNPEKRKMSRHVQVESHMSLTGSNSDNRILVKPSEQGAAIAHLCNAILGGISVPPLNDKAKAGLTKIAAELRKAAGKSLVVSASNNPAEQVLVNAINNALGNYGHTLSFDNASNQRQGSERGIHQLMKDIKAGQVKTVVFHDCNPVYDFANGAQLAEALASVDNKIGLLYAPSETAEVCNYILPIHHNLESWGDVEAKNGTISLMQPTISPLFDTMQAGSIFLAMAGSDNTDIEQFLKDNMKANFDAQSDFSSFDMYWDNALQSGGLSSASSSDASAFVGDVASAAGNVSKPSNSALEISFFETVNIGNGQYATNPWLMETPDPVARTSWGNYLAVPVNFDGVKRFFGMGEMNLKDGDLVNLRIGEKTVTVPVIQQFGQMPGTVSLALGYGRSNSGPCASGVGVNVNDCTIVNNDYTQYYNTDVEIVGKAGKEEHFSCVQYHHTLGVTAEDSESGKTINADEAALAPGYGGIGKGYQGSLTDRSIIFTSHVDDLDANIHDLKHFREHSEHLNSKTLYPYEEYKEDKYEQGHHWGLHVDLNSCTGCTACTVACMSENNVPVVGKREVSRHHEMTWLRIDRYYYGDVESPNTVYQPMMCQHCDNAPCENVCPVNATNHSSEGLNQMAYNRCIGTRYCANNCPYKVRRFNWYDYTTADIFPGNQVKLNNEDVPFGADNLTRMVLNPDVTVRSRGVIEKCSFCVQRLQEGKLTAKAEGRKLQDSDITTACVTACPTGALTFGDVNDKHSEISKKLKSDLNYNVLEEINVRSSVTYTMKVNNRDNSLDA
jgi:molybdopterin-containing oxidoreductase family iron-sulfur binding subunit